MKTQVLIFAAGVLVLSVSGVESAINQTNQRSSNQTYFVAETADLVNAGQASLANAVSSGYTAWAGIASSVTNGYDGQTGREATAVPDDAAADVAVAQNFNGDGTTDPWTLTFYLNTNNASGGCSRGYVITTIRTIAAFRSGGFNGQQYDVLVRTNGGSFSSISGGAGYSVPACSGYPDNTKYGASPSTTYGATRITLTDDTGAIAYGADAVRFSFTTAGGWANNIYREFDVLGYKVPNKGTMIVVR